MSDRSFRLPVTFFVNTVQCQKDGDGRWWVAVQVNERGHVGCEVYCMEDDNTRAVLALAPGRESWGAPSLQLLHDGGCVLVSCSEDLTVRVWRLNGFTPVTFWGKA